MNRDHRIRHVFESNAGQQDGKSAVTAACMPCLSHMVSAACALVAMLACALAIALFQPGTCTPAFAEDTEAAQAETAEGQFDDDGAVVVQGVVVEDGYDDAQGAQTTQIEDDANPMASGLEESATEQIDDDENPMASGLEAKHAAGVPLYFVTMLALAGVVVFFVNSMRRVNSNIAIMNRKIR